MSSLDLCQMCREQQKRLNTFALDKIEKVLTKGESICGLIIPKPVCAHYVNDLGLTSLAGMFDRLEQTDALCRNLVCPESKIEIFEVDDFRRYVAENFPRIESGRRLRSENARLSVLAISDVHLQRSYKPGTKVDCGLPAGCCNEEYGMPGANERAAGYWGTRESNCDIPDHTFLKALEHMKGNDLCSENILIVFN